LQYLNLHLVTDASFHCVDAEEALLEVAGEIDMLFPEARRNERTL
jgi:hypothetical protein